MSSVGYLQVHAYTSSAQIPIQDAAIVISTMDQTVIALRLTDRSGLIGTVEIPVPEKEESQEPGISQHPYTSVNLYAQKKGYEHILAEDIQIFAGVTTYQDLQMIPLSDELGADMTVVYETPPQDL